ncbi:MAG: bifunctional diaminohydroxyphosphoribosylaminopyrimidine deaminase/5-amino-6-(5-phosphoribosylamino)uracil reductase RibD [Salibacteraceae bacterium]
MNTDEQYMQRCFELAVLGSGHVAPNPMVGSVIVLRGKIIGEGYHKAYGKAHAEVNAINSVKDKSQLSEATLYVNLEPCSHQGKTPPCADLIIQHQLKRVVICNSDPFEKVNGKGIERLKAAGIDVKTNVLEMHGRWLNRRFFTFHNKQRPYIILKFAQTNDGFMDANRDYDSDEMPLKITRTEADRLSHKWRSEEAAILVGINTVLLDNPSLTTRKWAGKNPLRLIIDPDLQITADRKITNDENHTWIFNALKNDYCENNLCYIQINDPADFQNEILAYLHQKGIQSVIVEGGATTIRRFIESSLWDEARIFTGTMRIGAGVHSPEITGKRIVHEHIGEDLLQFYVPD